MIKKIKMVLSLLWDQIMYSIARRRDKGRPCVRCMALGSSMFPSKKLFEMIQADHPDDKEYFVVFSKIMRAGHKVEYVFFVNPDWDKHGVSDPRKIMTQQMVMQDGRVGMHIYQPTIHEIFTFYGISGSEATLRVSRRMIDGEPYYVIERP